MKSLHLILDQLYREMMPLCAQLIGVSRLIAGFGALWFIGMRIWRHMANAEPVDLYALLRPFVLGFCILVFPSVVALINGVLQPTVAGTEAMVKNSNAAIEKYLLLKDSSTMGLGALNPANWIRELLRFLLELVFEAASLCINTIRTFYLVVLSILGPFVFAISIYDGFHHTVTVWLARYVNVFLWLPVANIFGAMIAKIQENMILAEVASTGAYDMTGTAYLVFLLIAIVGYFTVPSVANYIVNAGGGNALVHKISSFATSATKSAAAAATGGGTMAADAYGNSASRMSGNMADNATSNAYFKDKIGGK
ncbi:conjugative transposon protein TraJ [Sediminibacterium roseum]|uniref:Conjugative transposon protein TraJ n=1 Tax=Sediminibacterium roseum TaxID=1978412 RepID=A0ABW9ZVX0_9BACT|nr:conjugative transposon protein TraJ [Sediminibacterium roseum]NCI51301.1 conjugative transposon protein TraJ [Sediminibacterium roseum]